MIVLRMAWRYAYTWQIARSAERSSPHSNFRILWCKLEIEHGKRWSANCVKMNTLHEGMASCSGRTQMPEASHTVLTQHLPSRRLQKCVRIMCPDLSRSSRQRRGSSQSVCAVSAAAEVKGKASRMPSLPFVKVAEQEDMKLALMLNVIDPSIGGVLIMGERGTGKSVAV